MTSNEPVKEYGAALRAMINRAFLESEKHQGQQWRANREGAHPRILEFEKALVKRFASMGVPLFAHCVVRTPEDQTAAYVAGHSRIKGTDPYPHRAFAVDIIHGVKGWNLPEQSWDLIGHVGFEVAKNLGIGMVWGGDWDGDGDKSDQKLYDPAHWELAYWRSLEPFPPFMSLNARAAK